MGGLIQLKPALARGFLTNRPQPILRFQKPARRITFRVKRIIATRYGNNHFATGGISIPPE